MFVTPINYHDFKPRNPPKPLLLHQKQFRICILILKTNITSGERAKPALRDQGPRGTAIADPATAGHLECQFYTQKSATLGIFAKTRIQETTEPRKSCIGNAGTGRPALPGMNVSYMLFWKPDAAQIGRSGTPY
ncbi:hypothetical protein TWF132_006070 [Orbilia oligospora]|nr:hypothetical protein TWF132_006070 [Orbilia oligospora]